MFEGLSPEVEALLNAAKSALPVAKADAGLLDAMVAATSQDALTPTFSRRRSMLGKVLTAKAAALAGVLVLTGGVASAATGSLPDPVQDTASHAAEHVGLHIPKSDDDQADVDEDVNDDKGVDANDDEAPETVEHPDNHGKDVSTVAHDDSNEGRDHGTAVCTVASDGKCQPAAEGQGQSADHRQDGEHHDTADDNSTDDAGSHGHAPDTAGQSGESHGGGHSGGGHSGSDDD